MPYDAGLVTLAHNIALQKGLIPYEIYAGIIAESAFNPTAVRPLWPRDALPGENENSLYERYWPDVSAGLGQQTVAYAREYHGNANVYPGIDEVKRVWELYFDPAHAIDVMCDLYHYWRYDPEVSPLQAWCGYNGGSYWYRNWPTSPNRRNYENALVEAQTIGMGQMSYNPDFPPERQVNSWACSIRTLTWSLRSIGVEIDAGTLQDIMVPAYVTSDAGLLDGSGTGLAEIARRYTSYPVTKLGVMSWGMVQEHAGNGPLMVGSPNPAMYHWFPICRQLDGNTMQIANPAPNWPTNERFGDRVTSDQFSRYGPWFGVFIEATSNVPPSQPYKVGSGVRNLMIGDRCLPIMDSVFFPLGANPGDVEMNMGDNGVQYWWHIPTGRYWRVRP